MKVLHVKPHTHTPGYKMVETSNKITCLPKYVFFSNYLAGVHRPID